MFITLLYNIIIYTVPCEPNTNYKEQHALIEHLKENIDINKIKTFYCKYTLFSELYFLLGRLDGKIKEKHSVFEREIAWDNYLNKGNFLFTDFYNLKSTNEKDIALNNKEDAINNKEKQETRLERKKTEENDIPKTSLVDLIKTKLEQTSQQYYIQHDNISHETTIPKNIHFIKYIYQRYKGKEYNVIFKYFEDGNTDTVKIEAPITNMGGEYSILYTFFVIDLRQTGKTPYIKYITLSEFLESPGPFHISKEDRYTVLWHYTRIKTSTDMEYELPFSIDIWIDSNWDIHKIDFIHYYSRLMDIEKFHEVNWNDKIDYKYPSLLIKRIEYSDYRTFDGNIRIPLHVNIIEYETNTNTEEGKKLEIDFRNGTISPLQYLFNKTKIPMGINLKEEYFLDPNSIKVNQKLSKEIFQPPDFSQNKSKTYKYSPLFFVCGCVFITIAAIYITNRYFGWHI